MSRSIVLFPIVASLCIPTLSEGQGPRFGIAIGRGLPAGDSRVVVDAGDHIVTGSGQAGLHLRGMVEWPLNSTAFTFRAEFFYNRLYSSSNTVAVMGDTVAKAALTDRTVGIMNSFVASLAPNAGVAPYFVIGGGRIFW